MVPAKGIDHAKTRLAGVLPARQRQGLIQRCLTDTVQTLVDCPCIDHVLVVTADTPAADLARTAGAEVVHETQSGPGVSHSNPHAPLNQALSQGRLVASEFGASALLTLPIDLVLLPGIDLDACLSLWTGQRQPFVAIASDDCNDGTNLLLQSPIDLLEFHYGQNSADRHRNQARGSGAHVGSVDHPGLDWDLDSPNDPLRLATALLKSRSQQGLLWRTFEKARHTGTALPFLLQTEWAEPLLSVAHRTDPSLPPSASARAIP